MPRRILIIVGHPDPGPKRLCRALAESYAEGARSAGHAVRSIDIATLDFPLLRTAEEFAAHSMPATLEDAVQAIRQAEHIVFVFPLWLGTMPALLKAFLEQVMRPGVAFAYPEAGKGGFAKTLLKGRSARVVVTMGMPAFFYRLWYLGHGVAGMRRNILNFVGISPVRETLFGMVEGVSDATRREWLARMRALGARAA
ncbi:NAD(P)H-dependent oxidoreductase [Shinella pollutisoli]|uniref:NAD(P)H-dependent oxidoreductase n=1 Tax=Shinella pollutisoli TaxID=2250594 RepID=A0ABV7DGJ1_9HYPH|nr:NAD(P)H-dependent oxidoreductase [Shinella pollutisoli]